ncbi:antitoxin Xre/MbcA/ParS toxin-binding domain-containing protein [Sphingomonas corticis]|uniref:DUF2384 domain-containing protein n=1 Tax=Sphingomonas corticis TaxID=2722791 RepID=A0ABX1CWC1_9SPHN|nr:antitoxin Xre/MbcA/ParS toxin-binding domain-containing protein [Sphingomonas corticis]NJR80270.1 DUF2384 domain-containing protein [Sphingomonas corticis]
MTDTIEDLYELGAMRASWHALAVRWAITPREMAAILPDGGIRNMTPPATTERRMRRMLALDHRLPFYDDADARAWLRTPIPQLGDLAPIDLLERGDAHVRELLRFAEWSFGR